MARDTLTGSRIRERRLGLGLKQADLAERAGISASYLNLIEHNRRGIGGKLLNEIAAVLGTEPAVLSEGAGTALIAGLKAAVPQDSAGAAELDRLDEFAGRFPGWAQLLIQKSRRIDALERTVIALTDRLTHDPHLAANLHEMLTTVTSIRSTASILAEPGEIAPDWQRRFHRNINDDSARLAEISQGLVSYLDTSATGPGDLRTPQEELDAVLARVGWRFDGIEDGTATPEAVAADLGGDLTPAARSLLRQTVQACAQDVAQVPRDRVIADLGRHGTDPFAQAARWGTDPATAMRRIAALAEPAGLAPVALVACDAAGILIHRQPVPVFPLPRFGPGCAMLPLYRALADPHRAVASPVVATGDMRSPLLAYAYAAPVGPLVVNAAPLLRAYMLVTPEAAGQAPAIACGVSCRICPQPDCPGRSEPSVLAPSA